MSADASNTVALAVDLDGTLIRSDLFVESILTLLRRNPLFFFAMLRWLLSGRAVLKRRIAERVTVYPKLLPYLEEVLQYVRAERAAGRHTVLATGSDENLVQPVADYLACFDTVIASDGVHNHTGRSKERQLTITFGDAGFDYIGNSVVDLPVWRRARVALLAAPTEHLSRRLAQRQPLQRVFYYPDSGWRPWARQLYLRQWLPNLLVFLPLLLSSQHQGSGDWISALTAYMALCLCCSGLLLCVDLLNLSDDRQHAERCSGPLASGNVYLLSAALLAPLLLAGGVLLAIMTLPSFFVLFLASYSLVQVLVPVWEDGAPAWRALRWLLLGGLCIAGGGAVLGVPAAYWAAVLVP
jgi:phosphoserine phosphatase